MASRTSTWRVERALAGHAADRVPFFVPVTILGARLLGVSIRSYLGSAANIVRGQLGWRERLGHDVVTAFHSAAAEVEAFGGEVLYFDDGPPNAGQPPLRVEDLGTLTPPRPDAAPALRTVLEATRGLAAALRGEAPVLGLAIGPFSLPAMQLGLATWLELIHEQPRLAERLVAVNAAFCTAWANMQVEAGASVIAIVEPLASSLMVPRERWLAHGRAAAAAVARGVRAPWFFGFGSAPASGVVDDVLDLRPAALFAGAGDDLGALKARCDSRTALIGGLDALALAASDADTAQLAVRRALDVAAPGGGFILSEHHGEIPWTTSDDTLLAVADEVQRWGACGPGDSRA